MIDRWAIRIACWLRSRRIEKLREYKAIAAHKLITIYASDYGPGVDITKAYLQRAEQDLARAESQQRLAQRRLG